MGLRIRTDEEIAMTELKERRAAAGEVLARLPDFVRTPEPPKLLEQVRDEGLKGAASRWLPERGSLLLLGPTSRGKSSAAAYCFRRVLGRGVTYGGEAWAYALRLRWFHANQLERARIEHPLGKDEAPAIREACRATLLVLDDAGWERDTSAVSTVLAERYESGLPTILTSFHDRAGLSDHYGAAVVRRLVEAGGHRVTIVEAA
jgi:DNA replication protein DnaC